MTMPRLTKAIAALALSTSFAQADTLKSAGILEFGPENTLFVADSVGGTIHAYELPGDGIAPERDAGFNILDLDTLVENTLGTEGPIVYGDLVVHPVTRAAYISLAATIDGTETYAVFSVSREGDLQALNLSDLPSTSFKLADAADDGVTFWRDIPAPTLTVTDLDFVDGELFVSGVSTGEFASTLRRIPYPFDGSGSASGIEIYHAAHDQNETRAPIRAMTVLDIEGSATVVAAYTCTPLVTIPVSELENGANVTGRTIAELGYGNTPLDVISFSSADATGAVSSYVLVVNREMDADLISMDALKEAANSPGLSEPIPYLGATAGVETIPLPMSGVVHVADQDNQFLLAMRRDLETGAMELVSFRKGAFFRLSDFISEYNFPDYVYADNQMSDGVRMFQNMLKADEGFPGQIRQ